MALLWGNQPTNRGKLAWYRLLLEHKIMDTIYNKRHPAQKGAIEEPTAVFEVPDAFLESELYVEDLRDILSSTRYLNQTIVNIFVDMHSNSFEKFSSVNAKYDIYLHKSLGVLAVEMLANINLYDHTMRVAQNVIDKWHGNDSISKAMAIVIALFHDFGKCPHIVSFSKGAHSAGGFSSSGTAYANHARISSEEGLQFDSARCDCGADRGGGHRPTC